MTVKILGGYNYFQKLGISHKIFTFKAWKNIAASSALGMKYIRFQRR